jgi:hypothetical protein
VLVLVLVACAEPSAFWPLVLVASAVPWLPLPGRASWPPALLLPVALLATTAATHAIFFGEDRYHIVVAPVLAVLAAAALRKPRDPLSSRHGPEVPRPQRARPERDRLEPDASGPSP